jgi:Lambda phage tail tube protein, TTP
MSEEIKKTDEQIKAEAAKAAATAVAPVKVEPVKDEGHLAPGRYGTGGSDAPQLGLGTTLVMTPATGSAITAVKVQGIKIPTWTGKDVETTGMNDSLDTYIPGVPNAGEAEFDILYLKAQSAAIQALGNLPLTVFVITYADGRVKTFTGWVNSYGEEVQVKEKISCKIKVRATTLVVNS